VKKEKAVAFVNGTIMDFATYSRHGKQKPHNKYTAVITASYLPGISVERLPVRLG
jgi:hypothetical protein